MGTGWPGIKVNYEINDGRGQNQLGAGYERVMNTYNFPGQLTTTTREHTAAAATTTILNKYSYDHAGRKITTKSKINANAEIVLSKLEYNELGMVKKKNLHSTDSVNFYQNTRFAYNERGWLKGSNSAQFNMRLGYDTLSNPQYNGNIAVQRWGAGYANQFLYTYDALNRLTNGTSTGIAMSEALSYDKMGNIAAMNRDAGGSAAYSYTGNRLTGISGGGLTTGSYAYDVNGNATTDGRNAMTLRYNMLNLIDSAYKSGTNIGYRYTATGQKLRKISSGTVTQYVNGIQYTAGKIDFIQTEEGRAIKSGSYYFYNYDLTDHLGNVRYTFDINAGAIRKLQEDDYYAFGLQKVATGGTNKYLYNGKELQSETGMYDYGARQYDPVIGRWNVIDRYARKYANLSTYQYGANNPISNIDINGDSTWTTSKQIRKGNNITIYNTTHISGRVLKPSLTYGGSAGDIASGLNRRLNAQSGTEISQNEFGGTTTIVYNIDAQYRGANSMEDVKSSDHLVVVVDDVGGTADPNLGGGAAGGVAKLFGKIAYAEGGVGVVETAFHEVGHNLGLIHPKTNSSSDPMSYSGDGANFSVKQMNTIYRGAKEGFPNDGHNSARITNVTERYNARSSNTRPYMGTRKQGMKIPLPIKD